MHSKSQRICQNYNTSQYYHWPPLNATLLLREPPTQKKKKNKIIMFILFTSFSRNQNIRIETHTNTVTHSLTRPKAY